LKDIKTIIEWAVSQGLNRDETLELIHSTYGKRTHRKASIYLGVARSINPTVFLLPVLVVVIVTALIFVIPPMLSKPSYSTALPQPVQQPSDLQPFLLRTSSAEVTVKPRAKYSIEAMIVSRTNYGGWSGEISPFDFALAWGRLVLPEYSRHISYSQFNRWYYYSYSDSLPENPSMIALNSANVHIVPSDNELLSRLKVAKKGDIVRMNGYLVDLSGIANGQPFTWNTSLSRSDTGDGACEILLVNEFEILK